MTRPIEIQIAAYLACSRANGPGLRSVVWVQGCPLRCLGCFNPDFWPYNGGKRYTIDRLAEIILAEANTEGVSFSGGEPFSQAAALALLAERIRTAGKGVLVFSGFSIADLRARKDNGTQRLLATIDLLVAGPYEQNLSCKHPLLASSNQELIYLTERYRNWDLGPRRIEYHISLNGMVAITGFPLIQKEF